MGNWRRGVQISFLSVCLLLMSSLTTTLAQTASGVQSLTRDGQRAIEAGDFARALTDFEQAYRSAPNNQEVVRGLLLSNLQSGQLAQAVRFGRCYRAAASRRGTSALARACLFQSAAKCSGSRSITAGG